MFFSISSGGHGDMRQSDSGVVESLASACRVVANKLVRPSCRGAVLPLVAPRTTQTRLRCRHSVLAAATPTRPP